MLKAAIIGFGGIAKSHRMGYYNLEKKGIAQLVCACDIDPSAFDRKVSINIDASSVQMEEHINFYTDLDEMLEKEDFDFADICAPTYVHAELSIKLLKKGCHVMCEKPMALNFSDCEQMMLAAKDSGRELMVGQCLRFEPAYNYLKEAVDDGRFGKVQAAFFSRLSAPPIWGYQNWFLNSDLSGGCLTDMHIHDVDMVRYLFGEPKAVACQSSADFPKYGSAHTSFIYNGEPISAVGDWTLNGTPFSAGFRVNFDNATVIFENWVLTVYPKDAKESYKVELSGVGGYEGEIAYFCDVIEGKTENLRNPAISAATTIRLIEHMRESVQKGGAVVPFNA